LTIKSSERDKMKYLVILIVAITAIQLHGQDDELLFRDHIYSDNIRSVKFHLTGLQLTIPIVELGQGSLTLSFDDMEADSKYYRYTVIHCDRNWVQSELWRDEYVDGFSDEEITEFAYSVGTRQQYTHYTVSFPNDNFRITKSGNYLLVIFDSANPDIPVITRRFMVVEPIVRFNAREMRPADVRKMDTHTEIRFEIDIKDLQPKPSNPKTDISATVIQNGRWGTAIQGISSYRELGNIMHFDQVDRITFPSGKEFRPLDIRSTIYRSKDLFEIQKTEDRIIAVVKLDEPRVFQPFFSQVDMDGNFVISTTDYGQNARDDIRSDYIETVFNLKVGNPYQGDVYIFGGLCDWELKDEFKMYYDEDHGAYTTSVWLKQGYYDYIYVIGNSDGSPDEATIEGNWYEATNHYNILIYFRPFGGRYDRIVGAIGL